MLSVSETSVFETLDFQILRYRSG
jgi:hypothetical protein